MKLVSNLNFDNGQCREAFERYAEVFGGEITGMMTWADMPGGSSGGPGGGISEDWKDKILHVWLQIGDQAMMGCDAPPSHSKPIGGFAVTFHSEDATEAGRVFDALAEGGVVSMPMGETFWSPSFGMLTDRFGTPWMINTIPAGAPR